MTDSISFGKKGNAGKIDLTKVKDGIKKADIAGNNKKLQSIFDKVDTNHNEVLEQAELQQFHEELTKLAGDDNKLTDDEAKGFRDADGNKMGRRHRKAFYEFLNKLAEQQQDPAAVQQSAAAAEQAVQEQVVAENPNEIPENVEETVVAQAADEIVPDSETEETTEPVDPPTVEEEPEPEVTGGIIVQNGESPAMIAKKFGVSVEDLLAANEGQLKGKGKNKYFLVGAEIVIPRKIETEELAQLTAGRKSAAETTGDYAQQMAIRQQRRAQQQAENEALGIQNRNGAGTKITGKYKGGQTEEFTVIGEAGRGRTVAKTKNGKIVTISHDGMILKETYVQKTNFYDRKDTKKVTVNGKQYAVAGSRGDKHGRSIAIDEKGNQVVLSADNQVLRNDYVSASDARDAGASRATVTGGGNVTYVKDANGRVWYFDEKTGKALVKGDHAAMVQKEADAVSKDLIDGANYTWGTDEEKITRGINNIYSPEIMAGVNKNLKASDSTYTGDTMTTPVEALLIDELSRSEVRGHIRTLAANGAYGTGAARDAAMGRNAAREIKYEVHGGITGWTSTKDLKEAMTLADTRGARLATEEVIKNEVKGSPNEGSYVRQYIKEDDLGLDWSAQEIDQFDATWIKNGAYDHEHDQEHRNAVTGRLVFEYGNEESLHAGLEAIDPETADYQYISQRAAEENQTNGYQAHFNGQDALQTYIAGRATDESGTVETPEVSACNTLLFKGEKPVRIQAEEALYDAKTGNFSNMFDSMDPKVYEEMADMIADGEVTGCKNIKEAYDKALNSTKNINDKTKIKANAIVSGQIEFSDAEVAEFCVELMHRIDSNRGSGASSHQSASATNIADYQTAQLKAILQARPEILASVKEKVQAGDFSYSVTIDNGPDAMPTRLDHNTKNDYLAIISDSKHVANEAVFYDKDGNQITNPEEIAALTNANMQALQGMREYVAQLERDFKKGVDAEGNLSNMANYILTYSGLGTDRDDVATQYRNAKIMLAQLEAAAQGKLRDSEGNVISVQDLAQKITETQDNLVTTNGDYQSSMQMARMGIVLAPVIAVTTVATMGTSTLLAGGVGASLGLATATGTGTFALTSAGVVTSNIVAGLAAGATTYGLNAYEYNTSLTGNTAEAREQNAIDSAVAGVSTFIGAQQMGPVSKLFNNANAFVRGGGRLTTVLASDVGVGAAGEYVQTGTVTVNGVAMNAIFSATGNFIGIKSLAKKVEIPANTPHVEINNHPSHDAEVVNQALRHEQVQADHHAGYVRKRQQEADKLAVDMDPAQNVVTPEQQAAYNREVAYQPVPEADRPAFEAHQQQVAQAHAEAHELGNMVDPSSVEALQRAKANMEADAPAATPEPPVAPAPKSANQEAIDKLTQSIEDLDKQIARAESNMKSAARRGKRVTPQQEQQLARMKENRAAKQAELDALQKPAAEPEVVVKADEVAEDAVIVNADDVEPAVRTDDAQPAAKPEETPTPENIARDAQAIPDAEIPAEHRSMWKSCQEKINKILSGAGKLAMGEVKTVLSDLKTLYNAVKNVKVRTQIARLSKRIQAYAKSKLTRVDNPKRSTIVENYQVPEKYSLISDKKGVQIYRSEEWNGYCTEIEVRTKNGKTLKVAERQIEYNKITNRTDYTYNNDGQFLQAITRDKDNIVIKNEVVDPDGISIIYDCENGYVYADIQTAGLGENQRSAYELPLDKLRMAQEGKNPGITAANIAELSNLPEGRIKYGEPFQRVTTDEEADAVFRDFVQRKSTRTTLDNTNERFRIIETTNDKNAEFKIMDGWAKHYTNTEQGTPWKIHIYADTPTEWANAAQLCMPYLDKNGIDYKTISTFADLQSLAKDTQRGKAFTVYFKDEAAFLQTAQDLDRIFSNSGMTSSGKVANDAQIGESGFLSYRSEEGSRYGSYKPANAEDPYLNLIVKQNTEPAIPARQNEHPESVVETPSARSLSPMEIGEIGEAINRARNNYALDQVQARINRLPDSPQKETLQRQANLKSRELRQAEEPAIPLRKAESGAIEPEVYQVDVSDQADAIIAEAVPADYDGPVYELSEHGELVAPKENDVVLIDMDPIVTRSPREISNNIDMATTEFELDALEKEINALTDGPKKRELKEKLNQKRNEMNYSNIDEYNQTYEANNEPYYDPANDPANWGMLDDFNNDFGDDFGGLF